MRGVGAIILTDIHNINTINKFVSNTKSARNNLFAIK